MQRLVLFCLGPLLLCGNHVAGLDLETVVVTATRTEQPLSAVSSSIRVVDRSELEMVDAVHINQALSRSPGTWISRGNGQEHLTAIRSPVFTGPGSCGNFFMAEDGIPLRGTGFCNVNQLFDANTEQAGRIEVLRGPGTTSHGANAMHGVINVISLPPADTRSGNIDLELGPHDYRRIKLGYSGRTNRHAGRISLNAAHDGGYQDSSGYDQQKFNYRHDYSGRQWQAQNLLSVTNLNQDTAGYIEGEDAYQDSARRRENATPEAYRDNLAARFYSRWLRQLDNGLAIQLTPYARYVDSEFLQHFLPGQPLEQSGQRGVGLQLMASGQAVGDLRWRAGLDAEYTAAELKQTQFTEVPWSELFPVGRHYDYQVDSLAGGIFLSGDWQATGATLFNGGLRYNAIRYDYTNRMSDGATAEDGNPCGESPCRYSRPADRSDHFGNWSFDIGLNQDIGAGLALVATVKHAFRPPQATELYRLQSGQQTADIEPEQLNAAELGLRGGFDQLSFSLVGFLMHKENVIFADTRRRNISDGETRHAGLEFSLDWQLAEHWALALDGSYARHEYANNATPFGVRPEVDIEGNDIDTAPRSLGSARVIWDYLAGGRAELEWIHLGAYYLDPANQHQYQGYDLLNLRTRYQISPRFGVGLRLTNLTDVRYAERADYAFGEYRYFVGEPRSLYADFSIQF